MLSLEFAAILCLLVYNAVGFQIKFEETLPGTNDDKLEVSYKDVVDFNWGFNAQSDGYILESRDVKESHSGGGHDGGHDGDEDDDDSNEEEDESFDSWSVVWYIASFGGLIGFFLVVSCSEWCCRKHIRDNQSRRAAVSPTAPSSPTESPPPDYALFAPPSYDSLNASANNEKTEYDIYVVPVHAIGSLVPTERPQEETPPSYTSISMDDNNRRTT